MSRIKGLIIPDDRQLLLYVAAKVARLDAIVSSAHSILVKDFGPKKKRLMEQRRWALQLLYNKNIEAERNHLKTQFPEDYKSMDEYISLGEREHIDQSDQLIKDVLEGRIEISDSFQQPPKPRKKKKK